MTRIATAPRACFGIAALVLPLLAPAPGHAIDFAPPAPGHRFEYKCNSNIPRPLSPARTSEITIEGVDGGVVTTTQTINEGGRLEIRQPLPLYGTALVEQISTQQGVSRIVSGLDKFPSLRDLEVGSTHEGKVEWVNEIGKHVIYDVAITISDESQHRTEPFGYIPVIVIEETWTGPKATYKSKSYLSPERSMVIGWLNEIGKYGMEECWLTGFRAP